MTSGAAPDTPWCWPWSWCSAILKVAWTVGGGDAAWDVLVALEPKNWLDVLTRMGDGIVGWDLDRKEVANAQGCEKVDDLVVREPWWRS
ncbi:hypothetical protein [Catenulispora rubra]|uniref:hypothetical protein n=1 Tax=Catenulispora rubra TaxID=280293 RepID=UPI0018927223|nr:hypothetical protein [Catenulispora rubra]